MKWSDIRPSMVTHTRNLCSVFNPSKEHTQQWTHTRSSGQPFMLQRPLEQLGVRCLVQEHLSRGIDGGESTGYSLPPTDKLLPFWNSYPQPFDYESDSLNIRPQLPPEEAYLRNIECHQVARRLNQSETRQGKARQSALHKRKWNRH